jgi:carbon starvation protein
MHVPLWAGVFWEDLNGRLVLHAMPLLLGALCVLAIAYRYYSAFLAARVMAINDARITPAHRLEDGQNYHPTNGWVLFGHHFAAISGAGPLIGPVLAIQYGYMPGLLWLVIGVCLAGAVQDMLVLWASVRRDGKSLAEIARTELGSWAYVVVSAAILFIVIIALAGLGFVVVKALGGEEVALPKGMTITLPDNKQLDTATHPAYTFPGGCKLRSTENGPLTERSEAFRVLLPASAAVLSPATSFKYEAMDQTGKEVLGSIEAADERDAQRKLLDRGEFLVRVNEMTRTLTLPGGCSQIVKGSSWGVFTIACTIPIALFVGWWMYVLRKGHVLEASLIGAVLVLAATIYGARIPNSSWEWFFSLTKEQTVLALVLYGFVASVLPVWLLLCPRDYLSSFLKIGTIVLLIVGVAIANPVLYQPMYNPIFASGGPTFAGNLFPFVFICIMCGAVSGFHALVSSGTTPKMIDKESHIRPIGYGAMLMEGVVGLVALVAAASLHPGLYYDINVPLNRLSDEKLTAQLDEMNRQFGSAHSLSDLPVRNDLSEVERMVGNEALRGRTGGAVTLAVGMSFILTDALAFVNDPQVVTEFLSYWYHFAIMFEALFILTTIDTGTRIARFLLQEALGKVRPAWEKPDNLTGSVLATAVVTGGWGLLVYTGSIDTIWPMFGIANQLLAVVALALVTTLLINSGRGRWAWVTLPPMLFVTWTTLSAARVMVGWRFPAMIAQGDTLKGTLSLVMTIFVVTMVLTLLLLAVSRWILVGGGIIPVKPDTPPGEPQPDRLPIATGEITSPPARFPRLAIVAAIVALIVLLTIAIRFQLY